MKILLIGSEGYIGSFINRHLIEIGHSVTTCDILESINKNFSHIKSDYSNLTADIISEHEVVVNLAAHSSVKMSQDNPIRTIENNSINLLKLALICKKTNTPLLYASSGSIYSSNNESDFTLKSTSINAYDGSKMAADLLLNTLNLPAIALCFGTVSGWSLKCRNELIFNSMNISAYSDKVVKV